MNTKINPSILAALLGISSRRERDTMKIRINKSIPLLCLLLSTLSPQLSTVFAQPMDFTYQGRLDNSGAPYTGSAEFQPTLWDAGSDGSQVAANNPATVTVGVTNGLFALPLDFGGNFPGADRWLQLEVKTAIGPFTLLSPRQRITATPYAITAGNFAGTVPDTQLSANVSLLGQTIESAEVADGAVTTAKLADGAVTAEKLAPGVAPKFISLNILAATIEGNATIDSGSGPNAGVRLADDSNGLIAAAFVVPPDYTPGTPLVIHMLWHSPSTDCDFVFLENFISVGRAGSNHLFGESVTTGLTIVGGGLLTAPATANQSSETLIEVTSPVSRMNLAPGDSIHFGLFRAGASPGDTCAFDLVLQSFWITYQ